jgi:hypothetical protein
MIEDDPPTARVIFSYQRSDHVGSGNSAQVFRVAMEHPDIHTTSVSLLAKLPYDTARAKNFVMNEGRTYSICPDYLSEAREGYIQTKPIHQPQPCCAVIPKFYGLYEDDEGRIMLLLEECGRPIEPAKLMRYQK